jgi:NIPSNAP
MLAQSAPRRIAGAMTAEAPSATDRGVVELRRYALHPGARETLIDLFEREFIETQEAVGMEVLGQFRDLDDPDSFVWLRGFRDMAARAEGLAAFYGGPVWAQHRDAANATMIDSDNVLLLRPAHPLPGPTLDRAARLPADADRQHRHLVALTICYLTREAAPTFPTFYERELGPALRGAGAEDLMTLASEHSPNNYPALPVREGEEVFVWLSRFRDEAAHRECAAQVDVASALAGSAAKSPETLRLTPTSRSLL